VEVGVSKDQKYMPSTLLISCGKYFRVLDFSRCFLSEQSLEKNVLSLHLPGLILLPQLLPLHAGLKV
jgi:hypothetical protein